MDPVEVYSTNPWTYQIPDDIFTDIDDKLTFTVNVDWLFVNESTNEIYSTGLSGDKRGNNNITLTAWEY